MPRYFFTIHGRNRVEDDRDGTYLPDVAAALSYAEYTIRELRKKSGCNAGPDDVRNGSIRANSFVLAVFSGLLKLSPLLTRDEAQRIAANVARVGGLVTRATMTP